LTVDSPKTYRRPPIIEAVIDLHVSTPVSERVHDKIVRRLKRSYPHATTLHEANVNVDVASGNVTVDQRPKGCRLSKEDETDVVLIKAQSLTLARLAPYTSWETLRDNARNVWNVWIECNGPNTVSRIGVRYINRIDIPVQQNLGIELEDYLSFFPKLPEALSEPLHSYLMQATIKTKEPYWSAKISSTRNKPAPLLNHISLLLDIDVFRTENIPKNEDELWDVIEEARTIKNMIFESSIKDETRELFNVI
jgi:uncharacterized protein (TIGR04255 family)